MVSRPQFGAESWFFCLPQGKEAEDDPRCFGLAYLSLDRHKAPATSSRKSAGGELPTDGEFFELEPVSIFMSKMNPCKE